MVGDSGTLRIYLGETETLEDIVFGSHISTRQYPLINEDMDINRYPGMVKKYGKVTEKQFLESVDKVLLYMCQRQTYRIDVDIAQREKIIAPPKEMTVTEIEKILGHKIKIIGQED